MSNRLESLNAKKPGAKPALKFKPKAVARKSKADRDKDAPAIKAEEPRSAPTRGRGGTRGRGRGRGGAYVGTHLVSSGPLALGLVSMGGRTSSKTGMTQDRVYGTSAADPLAHLTMKSRSGAADDDDDDNDATKINMSKAYAFDDADVVLFPVRPQKDEPLEAVQPKREAEETPLGAPLETPLGAPLETPLGARLASVESIKSEALDEVAPPASTGPDDALEAAEHDRHLDDRRDIVDMLSAQLDRLKTAPPVPDQYFVLHLPQMVPADGADAGHGAPLANGRTHAMAGHVGLLNFHKLGKITVDVGRTTFEATGGVPCSFLQEVVVVESHEAKALLPDDDTEMLDADGAKIAGNLFRLGDVSGKIVATPIV